MNLSDMRSFVRLLIGQTDSANSFVTDADIDTTINRSIEVVASELQQNLTRATFTTVDGQKSYGLPSDFMQMKLVEAAQSSTNQYPLRKRTIAEFADLFGGLTTKGAPTDYKIEVGATQITNDPQIPGEIVFYPTPDSNGGANYTITMTYYQRMSKLTNDTDVSELPVEAHPAVCYYAASVLGAHQSDSGKLREMMVLYRDQIERVGRSMFLQDRTGPTQVRDVMGYSDHYDNEI